MSTHRPTFSANYWPSLAKLGKPGSKFGPDLSNFHQVRPNLAKYRPDLATSPWKCPQACSQEYLSSNHAVVAVRLSKGRHGGEQFGFVFGNIIAVFGRLTRDTRDAE